MYENWIVKGVTAVWIVAAAVLWTGCSQRCDAELRDGDIIFHTSMSSQSYAIQKATKSKYSHCGIIYHKDGEAYVFEAVQPVKLTPLQEWIDRGRNGSYVVMRLKDSDKLLTDHAMERMLEVSKGFLGKDYDYTIAWSDDRMYCSELIWKVFERGLGIELCEPSRLGDFDLSDSAIASKLWERYGSEIPIDEKVVSPAALFKSSFLVTVVQK